MKIFLFFVLFISCVVGAQENFSQVCKANQPVCGPELPSHYKVEPTFFGPLQEFRVYCKVVVALEGEMVQPEEPCRPKPIPQPKPEPQEDPKPTYRSNNNEEKKGWSEGSNNADCFTPHRGLSGENSWGRPRR